MWQALAVKGLYEGSQEVFLGPAFLQLDTFLINGHTPTKRNKCPWRGCACSRAPQSSINHTAMPAASWTSDTRLAWPTWSDPPKADVKRSSQRKMSRDILGFHQFTGYIWRGFAELPCSRPRATNHCPPPHGSQTAADRMLVGGRGHLEVPIWWVGECSGSAGKMPLIPCIDCCSTETVCSS